MPLFKKAKERFSEARKSISGSPPQVPLGSKPAADKPDIMTLRDRFIVRNGQTGQLEVEGTGEVVRFASLCAPEVFPSNLLLLSTR